MEGRLTSHKLVADNADCPDVDLVAVAALLQQLRRLVQRRSTDGLLAFGARY